jgi:hypothetical protein
VRVDRIGFMIQTAFTAKKPAREPNSINLMRGILGVKPDLMKLELMHSLADAEKQRSTHSTARRSSSATAWRVRKP